MGPANRVKVLVAGDKQEPGAYRRLLDRQDCQCFFADSQSEAEALAGIWGFDIVLNSIQIPGGSIRWLVQMLSGTGASAFFSLRLEDSYWWLPVLRHGRECIGTAAFPPSGFTSVFDQLLKEIKARPTMPTELEDETFEFPANPTVRGLLSKWEAPEDAGHQAFDSRVAAVTDYEVEIGGSLGLCNRMRSPSHP